MNVSYQQLVEIFLGDLVQSHSPELMLINPHHDPELAPLFRDQIAQLDWLHNSARDYSMQFVGSHWWHSERLYKDAARKKIFSDGST